MQVRSDCVAGVSEQTDNLTFANFVSDLDADAARLKMSVKSVAGVPQVNRNPVTGISSRVSGTAGLISPDVCGTFSGIPTISFVGQTHQNSPSDWSAGGSPAVCRQANEQSLISAQP